LNEDAIFLKSLKIHVSARVAPGVFLPYREPDVQKLVRKIKEPEKQPGN